MSWSSPSSRRGSIAARGEFVALDPLGKEVVPVVTTGTTRPSGWAVPVPVVPQWSPVVTTGTTLKRRPAGGNLELAAMEPRRDDGDDPALLRPAVVDAVAAMEPRRDDGDDNTTEPRDRR